MRVLFSIVWAFVAFAPVQRGEVRVFGRIHSVSPADVRAAMVADQRGRVGPPSVHHLQVISSTEIRVYHTPRGADEVYDVVQRVDGQWQVKKLVSQSEGPI
jgi:hypothetical protein